MMTRRRDFIKISALGLGGLALAYNDYQSLKALDVTRFASGPDWVNKTFPTYCEVCFWKCAAWSQYDEQGNLKSLRGNEQDPHCNGRLCPRGTGGIGMYTDEDRLLTPLLRVEENGEQTFKPISWDEATDYMAQKMGELKEKYGPESLALFNHGSSGKHFGHLLKAYGSSNIVAPSYAQCRGPREVGYKLTYGKTLGSPEPLDIRDTRCLVLIGSHLGENMHNGQVQEMSDAIDKGADIITVDPRYSTAASKSKYWLPIKPATDMALLLAWIHVLIYEDLYDKSFVEKNTYGFEQLKHHVRRHSPEWAYGITTIKPDLIRKTARLMAAAAPAAIVHPGRHVTWYGDDTQRSRATAIINALLGNWGKRGGIFNSEKMSIPDYPHPPYPKPKWSWRDTLNGKYPLAGLALSNTFIEASIPENNPEHLIKGWIVSGTNLPLTLPDKATFEKAANSVEFLAVVDTMPMEITGYADIVLPECTYLERHDDLRLSPHREPNVALRMPCAPPKGESKPAWWMAKAIGEKLGLGNYFDYKEFTEVLDWQLRQIGSSYDEMTRIGIKTYPKTSSLYYDKESTIPFNTSTGKVELYSTELKSLGFDPLPIYKEHQQPPENFYRLIYGRAPMHTFSRTSNNAYLTDLMDENNIWINPKVAKIWNLKNGDLIKLKNQDGIVSDFPAKVRVTERIRWDSIYMVHGFGHREKRLSRAYGKGANDSDLITNVLMDDIMGGTGMRGNFVTFIIEPA
ncbi:MAG: molybdopterin-dependent oxidoreductase [Saprospiraceae bacterium]|nr:molybdopterin-dependent oxidoreductase [Saprospiraceae bacterium]